MYGDIGTSQGDDYYYDPYYGYEYVDSMDGLAEQCPDDYLSHCPKDVWGCCEADLIPDDYCAYELWFTNFLPEEGKISAMGLGGELVDDYDMLAYNAHMGVAWDNLFRTIDNKCKISYKEREELCYQYANDKKTLSRTHFDELVWQNYRWEHEPEIYKQHGLDLAYCSEKYGLRAY